MKKKGFLDISFSWIFAFLIGVFILSGTFYAINKFSNLKNTENSAELGTALKNLLTPLESGIESAKSILINLPVESKISHECNTRGNFGEEILSVEDKLNGGWTKSGVDIFFKDKYLFLPSSIKLRRFYVFSKPFNFPFEIANLMYFSDAEKDYCFVGFPEDQKIELKNLNQNNFKFENCPVDSEKICYGKGSDCNIFVNPSSEEVTKDGNTVYFEGDALMYAAIFSDKTTYDCELQRLKKRTEELLSIYQGKSFDLGCTSYFGNDFNKFKNELSSFQDSSDLYILSKTSNDLNSINRNSECSLW